MFVYSQKQFLSILNVTEDWKGNTLLDLGAGDGKVTEIMAPFFTRVYVTEVSSVMTSKLSKMDYRVLDPFLWLDEQENFDVITCLNLLDRCSTPLTLLSQLKTKLTPVTGRLIVALVIPCSQYVETGGKSHEPDEYLKIQGNSFETQINSFVKNVLSPMGFEVETWSRVPYLCEGDLVQSYFWLIDALFVLKVSA
ncbi:METTL9 [Cordylochernes scorpioides]|uniref:METTL9 n=1 Tax=Cordylochernes scorpioides TaxID=51811 RepID=A0ABY6LW39_9ARAC|nr:METTL9 [Cordylochernes scorpioides]